MILKSMTDFVDWLEKQDYRHKHTDQVYQTAIRFGLAVKYKNFLKQPLTLGMFVPCDEDGNVLEHPVRGLEKREITIENELKLHSQYQQAKERVLFEGDIVYGVLYLKSKEIGKFIDGKFMFHGVYKVESLVKIKPALTPQAVKQINGC